MEVKTTTWPVISFNLFDYSARNTYKENFRVTETCSLLRKGNVCSLGNASKSLGETMLRIVNAPGRRYAEGFSVESETLSERLWNVVASTRNSTETSLFPGDLLKLGRLYLRVRALSLTGEDSMTLSCLKPPAEVAIFTRSDNEPFATCRICLSEGQTIENPLISVCECAGTMKFIHLECLQEWLRTRLDVNHHSSVRSYHWKSLDCELCKTKLPMVIALHGRAMPLVEIHKSDTPFIVIEESGRRERGDLHVVSLSMNSSITIGRSPSCDIVLSDVSVSREHCILRLTPEGFFVEDNKSKFGTLRKVPTQHFPLTLNKEAILQINRTIVSLRVRRPPKCLYLCCYCCFPPRAAAVRPENSLLKNTISSVVVTTSNPEFNPDLTEHHLVPDSSSNNQLENTVAMVAISEDEERSRLISS